jgi:hypothetical protein
LEVSGSLWQAGYFTAFYYSIRDKHTKMGRALMTWERKILRIIYGPTYENGHWRIKINLEMYSNCKSPDILTVIKVRMLE